MRQEISVDKAIKRGHLTVNIPVIFNIMGIPIVTIYLSTQNLIPKWCIGISFILGFFVAWLTWSFMVTKWRIWAFKNVRNVHELKKRAIQEKLIWKDGSFFGKTEIRTKKDKLELEQLAKKFEREDFYREDHSVPPKTEIYYSKVTSYFELIFSILIIGIGIYFLLKKGTKDYILGIIMISIGLYNAIKELRKVFNNKPQIIIDHRGITTKNVDFRDWSVIENEEVMQEGYGKSAKSYLTYIYDKDEYEKIGIDSLNVTHRKLENLIRTYRIRNNKNHR